MAKRTIRRMPMTSDTDLAEDVQYAYVNFASPKGICDDKNFVAIDQQTFEDAKNVYIDNDGQLSSRPALKTIQLLPPEYRQIIEIKNVRGITFYHVIYADPISLSSTPYVIFERNGEWISHTCGRQLQIAWFTDKFFFFSENDIFAYDYDAGWLSANSVIYKAVTKQVRNGIIEDATDDARIDSPNIFGGGEITRYFYSEFSSVNWSSLIGHTLTVKIDDVYYEIIYEENKELTFVSPILKINITDAVINDAGQIIAWNDDYDQLYYSLDAKTFITLPRIRNSGIGHCRPVLSQDGSKAFVLTSEFVQTGNGKNFTEGNNLWERYTLSYIDLLNDTSHWTSVSKEVETPYIEGGQNVDKVGFDFHEYSLSEKILACGYCNDGSDNKVVFARAINLAFNANYSSSLSSSTGCNGYRIYTWNGKDLFDCFVWWELGGLIGPISTDRAKFDVRMITTGNRTFMTFHDTYFANRYITIIFDDLMKPYGREAAYSDSKYGENYVYVIIDYRAVSINFVNSYRYATSLSLRADMTSNNVYDMNLQICAISYDSGSSITGANFVFLTTTYTLRGDTNTGNFDSKYGNNTLYFKTDNVVNNIDLTFEIEPQEVLDNYKVLVKGSIRYVLTSYNLYYNSQRIKLFHEHVIPIMPFFNNGVVYIYNNELYAVDLSKEITLDETVDAPINYIIPSFICNFINDVIAYDNKINWRIVEYDDDDRGLLYFGRANETAFPTKVTNLVTLSSTEVAVFFENAIEILTYTENGYRIQQSKLQLGCRDGDDVLLTYDGSAIIVPTIKGLSAITYQQFVQSTEQVYTYLSNNVMGLWNRFFEHAIKLYQYKDWIIVYHGNVADVGHEILLYDTRSASWWYWETIKNIKQVIYDNRIKELIINILQPCKLISPTDKENYYDELDEYTRGVRIDWYLRSQKLHFDAPNNYKQVSQITLTSTLESIYPFVFNMRLITYKDLKNIGSNEGHDYEVNGLKIFIKRTSFRKINAFQFELSNYKSQSKPRQLVISNIAIKYRITERVR